MVESCGAVTEARADDEVVLLQYLTGQCQQQVVTDDVCKWRNGQLELEYYLNHWVSFRSVMECCS